MKIEKEIVLSGTGKVEISKYGNFQIDDRDVGKLLAEKLGLDPCSETYDPAECLAEVAITIKPIGKPVTVTIGGENV